jgi:PAS domain S-box-containing protein
MPASPKRDEKLRTATPLPASEELLDLFFDYAPAAFAIYDREMRYLRASKRWRTDYGLIDREYVGVSQYELHPQIPDRWRQAHLRGLNGETIRSDEDRFERGDGTADFLRWEIRPWYDSAGQVGGIIIFAEDITERKRAEIALRDSEQKFATVFNKASLPAILSHLPDYKIVDVNDAFTNLFGYTKQDCIGRNSLDIGLRRDEESRSSLMKEILRNGHLIGVEDTLFTKLGVPLTILVNLNVFTLHGDEYALTAMQDITERKRNEESLRRQSEQLRALAARLQRVREEERSRVARDLHDQIGQNLTAIKMEVEFALRRSPSSEAPLHIRLEAALSQLREATQALRSICTELRPGVLDDLGVVAAIEWQAREFTTRTSIPCELSLPANEIILNPEHSTAIFRIFQEALTNITRHAGASHVSAALTQSPEKTVLVVQDDGKGMQDREPKHGSLGILGMRERAEDSGGTLHIWSQRGIGTTLVIEIPFSEPAHDGV